MPKGQSKNGQSREIANIDENKKKKKHNTICVGHHSSQANTYNANKTWTLLQTTRGKDEPNTVLMWKS
jgi:hypothetical protein